MHKIAANHRITAEMELKPLASSETAWCWYAMDFSEGHEVEGSLEHLAVRFKTVDAAQADVETVQVPVQHNMKL